MNMIKKSSSLVFATLLYAGAALAGSVEPVLQATLQGVKASDEVPVIIRFADTVNLQALL